MHIKFIGTGGAFDHELGNSSALVALDGNHILIDCGYSIYPRLVEKGVIDSIDYLLITHLHDDHAGSLATTILHRMHMGHRPGKMTILYPDQAYKEQVCAYLSFSLVDPKDYVRFLPIQEVSGIGAIDTTNLHKSGMQSFAYYFYNEAEIMLYSGDIGRPEVLFQFLDQQAVPNVRVFHEMSFVRMEGVHTFYKDLMPFLDRYDIYAYHLDPRNEPEDNRVPLVCQQEELML